MSWSGPLAGAAPYQAPPYTNGQPGFGQHPSHQYGHQPPYGQYPNGPSYPGPPQRPQDTRPLKKKGNPIITRYPPPPGYRGPAQPHGPFNARQQPGQYQPPHQPSFPQVPPAQHNHPGQGYSAAPPQQGYPLQTYGPPQPSSYPPSYPQAQPYQWPQQPYQPNQAIPHASNYPGAHGHGVPQSSHHPYPPRTAAADPSQHAYNQAPGRPQAAAQTLYPPQSQYNAYSGPATTDQPMLDPNATPTPATTHLVSAPAVSSHPSASNSHDNTTGNKPELYLAWDDWDFDFDGAIWPKSNEPVDPNLSLGVIIWHPAKQMTRALPATFEEAEEQSLKPTPEKLGNGESVSIYFTTDNSHEAFLDVRQTDDWEYVQDDPAFVVFTDEEMQHNLVPVEDCIAQRDRSDEPVEVDAKAGDAEMHEADWSIMDHLEQALSASGEDSETANLAREDEPVNPQTQEDILALLGVTGLPKPVSGEPVSFPLPSPEEKPFVPLPVKPEVALQLSALSQAQTKPQKSQTLGGPRTVGHPVVPQRSYGSIPSSDGRRPPPPPPPEYDRYDPWNPSNRQQQYHTNGFNGGRGSPARSEASNGTAAGSDFGTETPAGASEQIDVPGSKCERSDSSVSRKRSYGDIDADDDRLRQHDDHTKRKRRSQVDAAYG
ncbi:hypothetical protein EKO04_007510 [Ascochyta lentis]|uniref:Uncharacterized protein n=1 Tax=Ascochyta lentis TaxID=205686 RepID=A0A8H7IZH3_9PLEO|nr:hypothetical protein EKO04_007510 [Ascochyta lentis]